jgi:hypothetical protein
MEQRTPRGKTLSEQGKLRDDAHLSQSLHHPVTTIG